MSGRLFISHALSLLHEYFITRVIAIPLAVVVQKCLDFRIGDEKVCETRSLN